MVATGWAVSGEWMLDTIRICQCEPQNPTAFPSNHIQTLLLKPYFIKMILYVPRYDFQRCSLTLNKLKYLTDIQQFHQYIYVMPEYNSTSWRDLAAAAYDGKWLNYNDLITRTTKLVQHLANTYMIIVTSTST